MARYLGPGAEVTDPDSQETYTTEVAKAWQGVDGLRPPAYMIGIGGFGVTYRAVSGQGDVVALKEYFPREFAKRSSTGQIVAKAAEGSQRIFQEGLKRFMLEGRLLSAFSHAGINRVTSSFELDGTAYHISPLIEGREQLGGSETGATLVERRVTLEHYLRDIEATEGAVIDLALLRPLLSQLLDAVEYVHTEGAAIARDITGEDISILLHRDIKPSNILVAPPEALRDAPALEVLRHPDTRVLLIDFGSARVIREEDDVTRTIGVVTEAYAPPELRDNQIEDQGAHTDIYSLAALVWRAFQGRPPSGTDLLRGAKLQTLVRPMPGDDPGARAPLRFLQAVDRGLNQQASKRPQSIAAWREDLFAETPDKRIDDPPTDETASKKQGRLKPWVLWTGGGAVAAAGIAFLIMSNGGAALEKHLIAEAGRAYDEARAAAERGESQALEAEAQVRQATTEVGQVAQWRDEADARYARYEASLLPREVFHGWTAGDRYYGDVYTDIGWCHKKGPNIRPTYAYSSYSGAAAEIRVDGVPGYSCGPSHTHLIEQTFTEDKNPWKVTTDRYTYLGQVDDQARPLGLGEQVWAGKTVRGRVTATANGQTWVGEAWAGGNTRLVGSMVFNPGVDEDIATWTGESFQGDRMLFRGHVNGNVRTGQFVLAPGKQVFGVTAADNQIMGRLGLPDGGTWVGAFAAPGKTSDAAGQAWGRLERGGRVFWGQTSGGTPNGCGVWVEADGKRQAGYFEGDNRLSDRSADCRRATYSSPATAAEGSAQ